MPLYQRSRFIAWLTAILACNKAAARVLYDQQSVTTWTNLRDLKDPDCDSVIKAVRRAKTQEGHEVCVSEIAAK